MVNVIHLDANRSRGNIHRKSLLARCFAGLLQALHESRRRQGELLIRRYRRLTYGAAEDLPADRLATRG